MNTPQTPVYTQFQRLFEAPQDPTSVWSSREEAEAYAASYPTAYAGQRVSFLEHGEHKLAIIQPDRSLKEVGAADVSLLEETGDEVDVSTPAVDTTTVREMFQTVWNKIMQVVNFAKSKYSKPADGIPKEDLDASVQGSLDKANTALQEETDPTVPQWAKQPNKPEYTIAEIENLPATLSAKEDKTNRVEISSLSTSQQYPTAKSVWDLMQDVIATIPAGGLKVPISIPLETDLPPTGEDGDYYFIENMNTTMPNRTGRAWWKGGALHKVFDQYYSADGESIILTGGGALRVSTEWLNGVINAALSSHTGNTTVHITAAERTTWNAKVNDNDTRLTNARTGTHLQARPPGEDRDVHTWLNGAANSTLHFLSAGQMLNSPSGDNTSFNYIGKVHIPNHYVIIATPVNVLDLRMFLKRCINGTWSNWLELANTVHTHTPTQVGLGSVANERQYSVQNPPPYPVSSVNDMTDAVKIEVGGRNYYKTNTQISSLTGPTIIDRLLSDTPNGFRLTGNQNNISSVRINGVINSNGWWTISFYCYSNGTSNVTIDFCDRDTQTITVTQEKKFYSISSNVINYTDVLYNFVNIRNMGWLYYYFSDVKIERGNTPTDWTPAPEDIADISHNHGFLRGREYVYTSNEENLIPEDALSNELLGLLNNDSGVVPGTMKNGPFGQGLSTVLMWSGYGPWGGNQLISTYNQPNPRLAIRQHMQAPNRWSNLREFAFLDDLSRIVNLQQSGNLMWKGDWTFSNTGVLSQLRTSGVFNRIISIPVDKTQCSSGFIDWLLGSNNANFPNIAGLGTSPAITGGQNITIPIWTAIIGRHTRGGTGSAVTLYALYYNQTNATQLLQPGDVILCARMGDNGNGDKLLLGNGQVIGGTVQLKGGVLHDISKLNVDQTTNSLRRMYDVASYRENITGATATGTIKITLPVSWTSTMLRIEVDGYFYTAMGVWKLILGGYNYAADSNSQWVHCNAILITSSGSPVFTKVRFAHDGTRCCILLGELTTRWDYPAIRISSVDASHNGHTTMIRDGWTITRITDETGITSVNEPTLINTRNASWLDGKSASDFALKADIPDDMVFNGSTLQVSGTADYIVGGSSVSGFAKQPGALIVVNFANAINHANPTLNVNNTGAAPIRWRRSSLSAAEWLAATGSWYTALFQYNSSANEWNFLNPLHLPHSIVDGTSGTLTVARGGTNRTSQAAGNINYATSATDTGVIAAPTANIPQALVHNAATVAGLPVWRNLTGANSLRNDLGLGTGAGMLTAADIGIVNKVWYAVNSDPIAQTTHIITIPGFQLEVGCLLGVVFSNGRNGRTWALNINSSQPVSVSFSVNVLPENYLALFQYDGNNWRLLNPATSSSTDFINNLITNSPNFPNIDPDTMLGRAIVTPTTVSISVEFRTTAAINMGTMLFQLNSAIPRPSHSVACSIANTTSNQPLNAYLNSIGEILLSSNNTISNNQVICLTVFYNR